jgi:hypothetical protein
VAAVYYIGGMAVIKCQQFSSKNVIYKDTIWFGTHCTKILGVTANGAYPKAIFHADMKRETLYHEITYGPIDVHRVDFWGTGRGGGGGGGTIIKKN